MSQDTQDQAAIEAESDGGRAFPSGLGEHRTRGMSLRDYFAAKAMQGLLAGPTPFGLQELVSHAHRFADAMIAARRRKE